MNNFWEKKCYLFFVPIKTVSAANLREHWGEKARRVAKEREAFHLMCPVGVSTPCTVTFTRFGKRKLDDDNLSSALKAARDGIAQKIGIDDGDDRIAWRYFQEKGDQGVHVRIEPK